MRGIASVSAYAAVVLAAGNALASLRTPYSVAKFAVTDAFHTFNGKGSTIMGLPSQTVDPTLPFGGWAAAFQDGYTGGAGQGPGQTAWAYDGTGLTQIGFSTGQYITSSNYTYSAPGYQTASGALTGYSRTFGTTGIANGQDAWVYSGGTTTLIPHLPTSGLTYNSASASRRSGYVSGTSMTSQFYSPTSTDRHAWVYNGSTTTELGIYDATHTASGSRHDSYASAPVGNYIRGNSTRFAGGTTNLGSTPWIHNAATGITTAVGYTGGAYTSGNRQQSAVTAVTASGLSVGYSSYAWDGISTWLGSTAWSRSEAGAMTPLSLPGNKYLDPSGNRVERAVAVNASGLVAGYSMADWSTANTSFTSADAWLHSGGALQTIPLPNTSFTNGYTTRMIPSGVNDAGDVAGAVYRYTPTAGLGAVPWVYHDGSIYQTGLFDADHTNPVGKTQQGVVLIGDSGVVAGTAYKYDSNGSIAGYDGWIFDPVSHTTSALTLSNRLSGSVYPMFITPEGWVGGFFDNYITDTQTNSQAFLWSPDTGLLDFNALLPGGLAAAGIDRVNFVSWVTPGGDIYATVTNTDGSASAAVFQAYVPEPTTLTLLAGVMIMGLQRRQRSATVRDGQ